MKSLQMPEFYPITTVFDLATWLDIPASCISVDANYVIVKIAVNDDYLGPFSLEGISVCVWNGNVVLVPTVQVKDFKNYLEGELRIAKNEIEQARATLREYGVGMED